MNMDTIWMCNGIKGKCMNWNHCKRAYGKVGFQKHHNNIDHLIAWEIRFYVLFILCLVTIFRNMQSNNLGCQMTIALQFPKSMRRLYVVCMGNEVKKGGPLSPTLFVLCIDDLDQMISKFGLNHFQVKPNVWPWSPLK